MASALVLLDSRVIEMEINVFGNKKVLAPSKFLHNVIMEAEQPDKQQRSVAVVSGKYSE